MSDNTLSLTITPTQLPAFVHIPSRESLNTVSSTTISIDVDYQRERYREQIREKCESFRVLRTESKHSSEFLNTVSSTTIPISHAHAHHSPPFS